MFCDDMKAVAVHVWTETCIHPQLLTSTICPCMCLFFPTQKTQVHSVVAFISVDDCTCFTQTDRESGIRAHGH